MDLVASAADEIVRQSEAACHAAVTRRLVVLSSSMGMLAAARWVAETTHEVWAHVDVEGPTDSFDVTGTDGWWTDNGMAPGATEGADWKLAIGFDDWEAWVGADPVTTFAAFFRPPVEILGQLPTDRASILDALDGFPGGWPGEDAAHWTRMALYLNFRRTFFM